MKLILILWSLLIFPNFLFSQSKDITIINTNNEDLHLSYENKFGDIVGVWVTGNETLKIPFESPNRRITFERNGNLFPCWFSPLLFRLSILNVKQYLKT